MQIVSWNVNGIRTRIDDNFDLEIKIPKITAETPTVAPFILIPFIENAFKYGTDYKGKTYVKISLIITDASIYLNVKNKIGIFREPTKNSGIGLENIRNQLELIYPGLHNLEVSNDGQDYEVSLTIYQKQSSL